MGRGREADGRPGGRTRARNLGSERQQHLEAGAVLHLLHPDVAVVSRHDALRDVEPEPGALGLRREERSKICSLTCRSSR